ncbi:MAG: helix-turn-helix transcriptional regulator [Lachnospiraceae bacterium]|nr:helix-turn-helix transcriptional regulator [Lachnospiraceae bacterium]
MAIYAPKAADNVWFKARENTAQFNDRFGSREGASEELGIERTRLARIETGISTPHTDEVVMMAEAYKAPELANYYCREMCPLGKNMPVIQNIDIDRITLRALSSLRNMGNIKEMQ